MRIVFGFIGLALAIHLFGCANTHGLTETEQREAIDMYPMTWANLRPDDGGGAITAKIFVRVLFCPLTIGISEIGLWEDRNKTYLKYADYLAVKRYHDSFLGKNKTHLIRSEGAPTRSYPGGDGGEILIYERNYTTGGEIYYDGRNVYSNPYRQHKKIREFYFGKDNVCYHWKIRTE